MRGPSPSQTPPVLALIHILTCPVALLPAWLPASRYAPSPEWQAMMAAVHAEEAEGAPTLMEEEAAPNPPPPPSVQGTDAAGAAGAAGAEAPVGSAAGHPSPMAVLPSSSQLQSSGSGGSGSDDGSATDPATRLRGRGVGAAEGGEDAGEGGAGEGSERSAGAAERFYSEALYFRVGGAVRGEQGEGGGEFSDPLSLDL
jgi:hypothetical protein